ncbi:MAG: enoyl-CoA hydratase-related protein [Planctomycetota bacterium]|jgi:methylglutaconyl-CoA hydratase
MSFLNLETLEVVREGPVLHVRLNRPQVRNAFNGAVVNELQQVFAAANTDDARVVLLSGNGKSFSAGADLTWMTEQAELPEAENRASAEHMANTFLAIARCKQPVVGRIHGHALGGGCGLTAAVDVAICTETTMFGLTEVKLGIVPAVISPFVMQKIGAGRARTLFLTGERFDGREAERVGLVHKAVPADQLDQEVQRVIEQLLSSGPAAVASGKELIKAVAPLSLEDAIPATADWIAKLRATPEAKEGMTAFLDKRKPGWTEDQE